ncbi:GNAT family N-acetyltransferase [Eubacteriales bacterium OttesenSCG-928-M02]|nr:GNAT family N-acetyltransferase [Eubacteriales bacterium OttesenSCG-928-M02]
MEITTRSIADDDRSRALWVEAGAVAGNHYLSDVWELFTRGGDGELTGGFYDAALCGIGKFTHLFGDYAWLELLRVHPDYQGMGIGKAIYRRYMEQLEERGLSAVGMYTGAANVVSRRLAERFGLSLAAQYSEYLLSAEGEAADGYTPLSPEAGEAVCAAQYAHMGPFVVINRTFYPVKPGLGAYLAKMGWLYQNDCSDILIAGTRFQPHRAMHMAYFSGDGEAALSFCRGLAKAAGSRQISALRWTEDNNGRQQLNEMGFEKEANDFITLWRGL